MKTNTKTADSVLSALRLEACSLASMPNIHTMCDARAVAFADLSSCLQLTGLYLADFIATNDQAAARKYLKIGPRASEAVTILAGHSEHPAIGAALLRAQGALVAAHKEFMAHLVALVAANRATVHA